MSRTLSRTMLPALVAGLVGATAMTPSAMAQTAQSYADQNEYCQGLSTLPSEYGDRLRQQWVTQSRAVVQAGDEAQCRVWYQDAVDALDQQDRSGQQTAQNQNAQNQNDVEAAASIAVTQPDPRVSVRQRAPLVSVTDPEPQVQVNQGQPQIIVRQAAPQVRVQIPQPIITIDQPQPEIIVRMPEPDVNVTNPKPQVEVRMREPVVNVQQPEPQVSVQGGQGSQGQADINLRQQEPEVQIQGTENQAQVNVQREKPSISYEQADPNIQIDRQGDPQVRYNQTGEPNIRIEQMGQDNAGNQDQMNQDNMSSDNMASDNGQNMLLRQPGDNTDVGTPRPYNVSDLEGRTVYNQRDQELGTVDRLVRSDDQQLYVVITDNGNLGFDPSSTIALPLDAMTVDNGQLVMIGMSPADVANVPRFNADSARSIGTNQRVNIGTR